MENFITGHLLGQNVDVYCGGSDKFMGNVIGSADEVLTLKTEKSIFTYIAISKIVAIWARRDGDITSQAQKKKKKSK